MSEPVIIVKNLGKRYVIGHQRSKDDGLRHAIEDAVRAPLTWLRSRQEQNQQKHEEFWALKDVSFEVQQGEILGIIGRNGAGKSTLLKILSRITTPTKGRIEIEGRVASLLEVGTGFHGELTGRENIFLNGAILGMTRLEINRKFDEIVAFSEIEKFLDTPVKRYSSGMYVRLAFAVAAHLEFEILIIDEVLAVGDSQFQKKCLGKIGEISKGHGRTVIVVSHNMGVIANLCSTGILLVDGTTVFGGSAAQTVDAYLSAGIEVSGEKRWHPPHDRPGSAHVKIISVSVVGDGKPNATVSIGRPIQFVVEFETLTSDLELSVGFHVVHPTAGIVFTTANFASASLGADEWIGQKFPKGRFRSTCTLPGNFLNDGTFLLNVVILRSIRETEVFLPEVLQFTATDTGGMRKEFTGHWVGVVRPLLNWKTEITAKTS